MRYDERGRDDLLQEIMSNSGIDESASCSCRNMGRVDKSFGLSGYPLAMVYSPIQEWKEIYDLDTALQKGTLFSELDLPFVAGNKGNTSRGGCSNGR